MRARLAALDRMSWWTRLWRRVNGERNELVSSLAALDAETAAVAYEIDLYLRTVESMLELDNECFVEAETTDRGATPVRRSRASPATDGC
jgi:hypothetical protein